ncbi:ferroxidase fet3 [Coemansia sp. RSA 1722]|nr:ferroxidase fet3 [Coemansia sp. RSA 1722]
MVIQYQKGAPTNDELISEDQMVWADDIHMQAFDKQPLLQVTRTVETTAGSKQYSDNVTRAFLRTFPYATPPKVPTLFSALSTDTSAFDASIYGVQAEAEVIDQNDVVEIHMINASPIDHAMHLHGHTFQITEYGPAGNNTGKATTCGEYPMRRDTFVVAAHRYIKVRFLADNPGVWLFHCHMDIHFALGLAMTFIEAPGELQRTQKVPEKLRQMCLSQGLGVSGNAAGNPGLDMTGLPEPPH